MLCLFISGVLIVVTVLALLGVGAVFALVWLAWKAIRLVVSRFRSEVVGGDGEQRHARVPRWLWQARRQRAGGVCGGLASAAAAVPVGDLAGAAPT